MKVYLISHKGKSNLFKMEAWARCNRIGTNEIYIESINAFLRKKDAKKWIKERGYNHLIIKTAEILE